MALCFGLIVDFEVVGGHRVGSHFDVEINNILPRAIAGEARKQ